MLLLLFECHRHGLDVTAFEHWLYVDTLHLTKAIEEMAGSCHKLQCMMARFRGSDKLTAHRSRDDCIALLEIMECLAACVDVPLERLMGQFAERFGLGLSMAQVCAMSPSRNA